ncbi:MAG TPA: hypothetical protein PLU39_13985 [Armatimonadota bacterium]|nr:hypothetical protein [Armatimonadota bacterium]HOM80290.1 hypothetical protein [Armatimonadota bacterium]HPO71290.1 hypothetical protein [Armatimonadota bacterium]HPT98973.1 hypothetical protein [Armatimonadota bacterium]
MLTACGVAVERLKGGQPILAPRGEGWESGHTYNPAAVRLGPGDSTIIRKLLGEGSPAPREGVVAILYRAQPRQSTGFRAPRSSIGLAVFTPELDLLRRFPEPVVRPTEDPEGYDYDGAEDPRVTRIGDTFYMVYCGYTEHPYGAKMRVCLARSRDLLHWEKLGPARGDINHWPNKDGVLLPGPIGGRHFLLHRPMVGQPSDFCMELAVSDSPTGEWRNCGRVLRAPGHAQCRHSWVGAGSVPIPLGDGRYLALYHTGNRLLEGSRQYNADAVLLDFRRFTPEHPAEIIAGTLERILVPETEYERSLRPGDPDPLHCVFPCGSYQQGEHLHFVYGGCDTYTLAARVRTEELLDRLHQSAPPYHG